MSRSLSCGKSGRAGRGSLPPPSSSNKWDPRPLHIHVLLGVWTQRPARRRPHRTSRLAAARSCLLRWSPSKEVFLDTVSRERCGSPVLGQVGTGQPALFLVTRKGLLHSCTFGSVLVDRRSPWPDAEHAAQDKDLEAAVGALNKAGVEWIPQERAVERVGELGSVFALITKVIYIHGRTPVYVKKRKKGRKKEDSHSPNQKKTPQLILVWFSPSFKFFLCTVYIWVVSL